MMLWVIFSVMSVLAVAAVLRPLVSKHGEHRARAKFEADIYREQLKSLEREIDDGAIGAAEARSARAEIGRRLLAVAGGADPTKIQNSNTARLFAVMVAILVPAASLGLYASLGTPNLPGTPAALRTQNVDKKPLSVNELIAKVQGQLRVKPDDFRGWKVLGPALMRLGRHKEAAQAYRRMIALQGPTGERLSVLGEALMFANGDIISEEALEAFTQAAKIEPSLPDPQYYLGLARQQDGDAEGAASIWNRLLDNSPDDAPWRELVGAQIAALQKGDTGGAAARPDRNIQAPGPGAADIAAAGQMSETERQEMISSMVARLDDRLTDEGGGAEEWLRLVNAYGVMGEPNKRKNAIDRARKALEKDNAALQQFEAGIAASDNG